MALDSGGGAAAATGGAQGADAVTDVAMYEEAEEGGGGAEAADGLASTRAETVCPLSCFAKPVVVVEDAESGGATICTRTVALLCLWYV